MVDDDPMVATTIQRVLRPEGYDVEVALDGQVALGRVKQQRPDLVVLDLMMPGVDGLEVCRRLRADHDLPILLLTARGGHAHVADLTVDAATRKVRRGDRLVPLSAREFALLVHFLRHPQLVLTRRC